MQIVVWTIHLKAKIKFITKKLIFEERNYWLYFLPGKHSRDLQFQKLSEYSIILN
jgi:hypothetical protein